MALPNFNGTLLGEPFTGEGFFSQAEAQVLIEA